MHTTTIPLESEVHDGTKCIGIYCLCNCSNRGISRTAKDFFTAQKLAEENGKPKVRWIHITFWLFWVIAFLTCLSLLVLVVWVGISMYTEGDIKGAVTMLLTALLIALSNYLLFLYPFKKQRKNAQNIKNAFHFRVNYDSKNSPVKNQSFIWSFTGFYYTAFSIVTCANKLQKVTLATIHKGRDILADLFS